MSSTSSTAITNMTKENPATMTADIPLSVRHRAMTLATDGRVIAPRGHLWKVLPDTGELDWFAYDYDPHSGLLCLQKL